MDAGVEMNQTRSSLMTQPTRARGILWRAWLWLMIPSSLVPLALSVEAVDHRGRAFIGYSDFSKSWTASISASNQSVLMSDPIVSGIGWDELVVSWNVDLPSDSMLKIEARAIYPEHLTKYYV